MKRQYIHPEIGSITITPLTILCGSDRISSNVDIHGGDKSGDVASAF